MNDLKAKEGYVYTNGYAYGHTIKLGVCDSASNWQEITEEEYNEILKEQEEKTAYSAFNDVCQGK